MDEKHQKGCLRQAWLIFQFYISLEFIGGEGNGNPFQYSCLENSSNRGAWWTAVHGIAQSQTRLKWLSSSSSRVPLQYCISFYCTAKWISFTYTYISSLMQKQKPLSCIWLFATPRTVACQAPLSMDFSRPEYWSGWLFCSLVDLPNPKIEPRSPTLQADSLLSEPPGKPLNLFKIYHHNHG